VGVAVVGELDGAELVELVRRALAEDLGSGDVTSEATVALAAQARAKITQKQDGVIYGVEAALEAFRALDAHAIVEQTGEQGTWRDGGSVVVVVSGNARALLAAERTALNFLGRLSGIATLTARAVAALEGTGARLLDTRKTTPGLRALEKQAVAAGGGGNYRFGLHDAILIKENHIATAGGVAAAVRAARLHAPDLALEVEVRNPAEIEQALQAGAPRLLLDNMSVEQLRAAVAQVAGRASLEASGGVTLETLPSIGSTGVDFVSMGALTHSAPALDLSLTLQLAQ
jgi:nicotinate-nucleotide pyrophosphorylase (carboxylating)